MLLLLWFLTLLDGFLQSNRFVFREIQTRMDHRSEKRLMRIDLQKTKKVTKKNLEFFFFEFFLVLKSYLSDDGRSLPLLWLLVLALQRTK